MEIDSKASFIHFVYPFLFDPDTFAARAAAIDQAEGQNRKGSFRIWESDQFPEDDLLAHVADYLNPPSDKMPTARLWKLSELASGVWGVRGRADWHLKTSKFALPFQIGDSRAAHFTLQLVLFRDGVGFLTVYAKPVSHEISDWLNFLHFFRFARGQRGVCLQGEHRLGLDPVSKTVQCGPFFPGPAGGLENHPDGCGPFGEIIDSLLSSACLMTDLAPWWREVFVPGQLLPYVGLYADGINSTAIPGLTYQFRQFFNTDQEMHPSSEDLRLDHPLLLPYAERQWFTFSLEGGGFLACDAPPDNLFFRQTLPDHLRTSYFLLFLLALHQRFALIRLSEEVAEHWFVSHEYGSLEERERVFTRIRDALLSFTVRGHFAQVMQREHHHLCYRKWLEVFQIAELYQEVRDEVSHIHDFLMMQRAERLQQLQEAEQLDAEKEARLQAARERAAEQRATSLEQLLTALATIFGVPALGLAFLQVVGSKDVLTAVIVTAGLGAFGVALYLVIRWALLHQASGSEADETIARR
jgi:hypothetical protein